MCAMELPSLPSADMNKLLGSFQFGVINIDNHSDAETERFKPRTPQFGKFSNYFPERALPMTNTNPGLSKSPLPSWSTSTGLPSFDLKSCGDGLLSGLPSFVLESMFDLQEVRKQQKEETNDMNIPTTVLESLEDLSSSKKDENVPEKVARTKLETKPAGKDLPEVMVVGDDGKTTSFVKFLNEPIEIPQELIELTGLGNNAGVPLLELPAVHDENRPSEIRGRRLENTNSNPQETCLETFVPRESVPKMTPKFPLNDLMKGSILVDDGDVSYEVTVLVPEDHEPMDVAAYQCVENETSHDLNLLHNFHSEGGVLDSDVQDEARVVESVERCYPPQGLFIKVSSDDSSQMNSSSNLVPHLPQPEITSDFSTDESCNSSDSRVYTELTTVQPSGSVFNDPVNHLTSFRDNDLSCERSNSALAVETIGEVPETSSSESSSSSSLNDKIKANMRAKIQKLRREQGKDPIKVSFEERPPGKLTEEERKKIMTRKMKNRESAVRSRKKTQERMHQLEKEVKELERENQRLMNENTHIKQEVTKLCTVHQEMKSRKIGLKPQRSSSKSQAKSLREAIQALLVLEGGT